MVLLFFIATKKPTLNFFLRYIKAVKSIYNNPVPLLVVTYTTLRVRISSTYLTCTTGGTYKVGRTGMYVYVQGVPYMCLY